MLRAIGHQGADISVVMATVNKLLTADLDGGRFVTCFFGLLDPRAAMLSFASAGHGPMLIYTAADDSFQQLPATGLPLGVMPDAEYDEVITHTFAPGDMAVVVTDGFFEAVDDAGEQFGIERIIDLLRRDRNLPAEQMLRNLRQAVEQFVGDKPQADDLTALLIRKA